MEEHLSRPNAPVNRAEVSKMLMQAVIPSHTFALCHGRGNTQPMQRYQSLIERIHLYEHPEISWNRWFARACMDGPDMTALGTFLKNLLQGGTFITIPCGADTAASPDDACLFPLVRTLGVATYVEVDHDATVLGDRLLHPARTVDGVRREAVQADILEFLSAYVRPQHSPALAVYLSGIQLQADAVADAQYQQDVAVPYLRALYTELGRICAPGDVVILNDSQSLVLGINEAVYTDIHPVLGLMPFGFQLSRTCPFNKVQVFTKHAAL